MKNIAVILITVLILAALIIGICIYAYNKRLDKAVKGEERDAHNPIPEPGTAANVIYKTVLMGIAVVSLLTVSAVKGQQTALQNTVNNLQNQNQQLYREVRELQEQLEAGEKRVLNYSWEIVNADLASRTADVRISAALKEFSDDTAVSLVLDGKEVPLEKTAGGRYTGQFTVNLFKLHEGSNLVVTEGNKSITEETDLPEYFFWDLLPMPGLECTFNSSVSFGKLNYEGEYLVLTSHPEDIASVTVTYMTNGKDLKTMDITKEMLNGEKITLEKGLKLEKDLTFRFEIVTKSGFRIEQQQVMIYETSFDEDSAEFLKILDKDGNLVWEEIRK